MVQCCNFRTATQNVADSSRRSNSMRRFWVLQECIMQGTHALVGRSAKHEFNRTMHVADSTGSRRRSRKGRVRNNVGSSVHLFGMQSIRGSDQQQHCIINSKRFDSRMLFEKQIGTQCRTAPYMDLRKVKSHPLLVMQQFKK